MPGDSMCNFVSQSLLSLPLAIHSQKSWDHTGPLAKMAQLPSQSVKRARKKGLFKVLAPSPGWLCSNFKWDFSPSKNWCLLTANAYLKQERRALLWWDSGLKKNKIRKLEANLTKNMSSKIIMFLYRLFENILFLPRFLKYYIYKKKGVFKFFVCFSGLPVFSFWPVGSRLLLNKCPNTSCVLSLNSGSIPPTC